MNRFWRSGAAVALAVLAAAGCDRLRRPPAVKPPDPLWAQFLAGHTVGIVSRKTKIAVRFAVDVFDKERVGQEAPGVLEFDPSVRGTATVSDPREVVFIPAEDLTPGAYYKVTVRRKALANLPEKLDDYEFVFQTLPRTFEVEIGGLTAEDTAGLMALAGVVTTADGEEAEPVEKVVFPQWSGAPLQVTWTHDAEGRRHEFTVRGLKREADAQSLHVNWYGGPLDVENRGERTVEIPGLNDFKITNFQVVQAEERYFAVYFSDKIDPRQNLKGLIRASVSPFTLRVEGNVVKIYPDRRTSGKVTVTVEAGVRNAGGFALKEGRAETLSFVSEKPQVRFAGQGVLLPDNDVLSIPFDVMNVHSVQVTAFQVYEDNIGQFLQGNRLDTDTELGRVGRHLWRKTLHLSAANPDQWQRYELDATDLLKKNPGALFRLTLSINRSNSDFACSEQDSAVPVKTESAPKNQDDIYWNEGSGWDGIENWYQEGNPQWTDREDPCKDAYFIFGNGVKDARNFLASNIGLLAKTDATGRVTLVATDLRTAAPLSGAALSIRNFQNQEIGSGRTDGDGFASIAVTEKPFYVAAEKDGGKGFLKMSDGTALPTSHFDVGGEKVQEGLKGFIYGERGVWRPGDDLHLVFVLENKNHVVPEDHPATLRLTNPQGQLVDTVTNAKPVNGFYRFDLKTAESAPTGTWTAEVQLGGSAFSKALKIETVVPNRLKIEYAVGEEPIPAGNLNGTIFSQWLHGATAAGLKTQVSVRYKSQGTRFARFEDHLFDDPTREIKGNEETIFEGRLDPTGHLAFNSDLATDAPAPGMVSAQFKIQVFEEGGAFSVSQKAFDFAPYQRFVGLKLPKGDQVRNMLLTDKTHTVSLVTVNAKGEPIKVPKLKVALYKVQWRWWWDQTGESSAQFNTSEENHVIQEGTASTKADGRGSWDFEVKYPDWGRYLVRACDEDGGHCAGQYLYIDWPGWAGRAQEQSGPGASVLYFFSDKSSYAVGETAVLQLPDASQGRGLMTVENGSRVLEKRWIDFAKGKTKFELPITAEMTPNVYVSVALLQPHAGKDNDRPLRLYGVIPLRVTDPDTVLQPVVKAPEEWRPLSEAAVTVSETKGRPMTYTLAIVDEGLLGLTGYSTPDPHDYFYRKEALGVKTWDLFDLVVGAYSANLERLLALGGSDALEGKDDNQETRRFPPVVRFLGPFTLGKGESKTHKVDLPQYIGQVRAMVVAGRDGAYGRAEKSVYVREPLSVLTTLPRVVGPEERIAVPVNVFVMKPEVKDVSLSIDTDDRFEVVGSKTAQMVFAQPGDGLTLFTLRAGLRTGPGRVTVSAAGGGSSTRSETHLTVRAANPPTVETRGGAVEGGQTWTETVVPHGLPGTNEVHLEVSALPPLNLERRLGELIRYPHGCVEQVTSSVFPQLYLPDLVKLTDAQKAEVEKNIKTGIDRLRAFQAPNGGFVYWPGALSGGPDEWATNYVGHFLMEAEKKGYAVPADMRAEWIKYQKGQAQAWTPGDRWGAIEQSFRLYTLALAGEAPLGAMNRLKESTGLAPLAQWNLAAAYALAGQEKAARELGQATLEPEKYDSAGPTYGSPLRDRAMILNALAHLKDLDRGRSLSQSISSDLVAERWLGTHE
ncbi:MAG TPA: MG2 domain-containing protein, partial [Elusimicrobiota bacterium]|nr:MG2 domain-containing protein [Elusimicrobiota bacterium]